MDARRTSKQIEISITEVLARSYRRFSASPSSAYGTFLRSCGSRIFTRRVCNYGNFEIAAPYGAIGAACASVLNQRPLIAKCWTGLSY